MIKKIIKWIFSLVRSMCEDPTYQKIIYSGRKKRSAENQTLLQRLIPIYQITTTNALTVARIPPTWHTLHRYPWLCSLRGNVYCLMCNM